MNARVIQELPAVTETVSSLQQLGGTLRVGRETRGVSVEEAATRLRLAPRIIRSMEEGRFEELPAATYARGYIRAYANFLGLTVEPLLQAYDRYADKPPQLNPFASAPPPQVQATDLPVRAMTYVVVALVVGLLGAWLWQAQQFNAIDALTVPKWGGETATVATAPSHEAVEPVPVEAPRPTVSDSRAAVGAEQAAVVTPPPTPSPTAAKEAESSSSSAATPPTPAVPPSGPTAVPDPAAPEAALAASAPGMQVVPAAGEIPYAAPAPAPGTSSADGAAVGVATGPQALSFALAEDSWIEVYDAQSKRLYYNIGRQGTRISVQGALPYRVKVGNAPAVLVSYQGHSLDISAFSNGSVARFQLTPDGFLAQP